MKNNVIWIYYLMKNVVQAHVNFFDFWKNLIWSGKMFRKSGEFSGWYEFILLWKTAFKHTLIFYIVWKILYALEKFPEDLEKFPEIMKKLPRQYEFILSWKTAFKHTLIFYIDWRNLICSGKVCRKPGKVLRE